MLTVQNSLKPQAKTSKAAKPIQTNLKPAAKSGYLAYNQVQLALDRPKTLKIWLKTGKIDVANCTLDFGQLHFQLNAIQNFVYKAR